MLDGRGEVRRFLRGRLGDVGGFDDLGFEVDEPCGDQLIGAQTASIQTSCTHIGGPKCLAVRMTYLMDPLQHSESWIQSQIRKTPQFKSGCQPNMLRPLMRIVGVRVPHEEAAVASVSTVS